MVGSGSSLTLGEPEDARRVPHGHTMGHSSGHRVKWGSVSVEDHLMLPLRRERRPQTRRTELARNLFRISLSQNSSIDWLDINKFSSLH